MSAHPIVPIDSIGLDDFIVLYKDLSAQKEVLEKSLKDLRAEWSDKIELHGSYHSPAGSISLVKPTIRTSYDNRALELLLAELHISHPEIAARIEAARKVTPIAGTWRVT